MKLAVIPPSAHLELSSKGDLDFCLAQRVLKSEKYALFYRNRKEGRYLIMDNGAFELGASLAFEDVVRAAKIVGADEVVAADCPKDPVGSMDLTKEWCKYIEALSGPKLVTQLVPHGRTEKEFVAQYLECVEMTASMTDAVIGFSILDLWKWNRGRRPIQIAKLDYLGLFEHEIEHHLLGLDDPAELLLYNDGMIRSVDTSLPISLAWNNRSLWTDELDQQRVPEDATLSESQLWTAEKNISLLKAAAEGSDETGPDVGRVQDR